MAKADQNIILAGLSGKLSNQLVAIQLWNNRFKISWYEQKKEQSKTG